MTFNILKERNVIRVAEVECGPNTATMERYMTTQTVGIVMADGTSYLNTMSWNVSDLGGSFSTSQKNGFTQ